MSQITVTGKAGPGLDVTAVVLTDIRSFTVNVGDAVGDLGQENVLTVVLSDGTVKDYDITEATTFTVTVAAGVYTIVVS